MKRIILTLFLLFVLIAVPVVASAQAFVIPCTGAPAADFQGTPGPTDHNCTWVDFLQLISNALTFLVLLSIPLATIAFAWSGFLMLTAAGSESKVSDAKEIFTKVLMGFIFVLTAWLIVKLIVSTLLNDSYDDILQSGLPSTHQEYVIRGEELV